ncbi:FAD-dependent oxidoreductase [Sporichthya sp.]|uniref:NAD(P)/FAD-dependent oxidoreductase n=1 Tax=Sporichthya sp. TaxID=65475 RepID=UPI00183AD724|nr:FAD-dependent oxidoreductase [Sporichthya sp.]MBA3741419.1 FAD-dependent oxidoreductase [Sporichthya sp.]
MDTAPREIAIVSAGLAGVSAAEELRREGFEGPIHLVGAEKHSPYDRPPLSKQILAGTWGLDRADLRTEQEYADLDLTWHQNTAATEFRPRDWCLSLDSGYDLRCDGLIIATGVRAREITSERPAGVHVLRTLDDALALRDDLVQSSHLVVIGAGVLGLEAAGSARRMGLDVTVLEAAPAAMTRTLGNALGALLCNIHTDEGVAVRFGVDGLSFRAAGGRVDAVTLPDGSVIPADVVLVAAGAIPNIEWLRSSGVALGNGVLANEFNEAFPKVFAAGDVCEWDHVGYGRRLRLEHRNNAAEQGRSAARNLLGRNEPFTPTPYFWTDHYDHKIQAYGLVGGTADMVVVEGELQARAFVAIFVADSTVIGAVSCNMARELRPYRQLASQRAPWTGAVSVQR